jgi:hypothetical protein
MPDLPISGLPNLTASTNTAEIAIVSGGVTYNMSVLDFWKSLQPFGTMYQDWIPDAPSAHTIGSIALPLKSIYVSTGSVFIGPNNSLAIDDSGVLYSTNVFAAPTFQVGNVTSAGGLVTTSGVTFSVVNNEMLMISNSGGTITNLTRQPVPTGGTANDVLTRGTGTYGWGWSGLTASQVPTRYYGAFYDGGTQPLLSSNTPQVMSADTTTSSNGIVLSGGTKFVALHSGVYNLQFSAQLNKTSSGTDEVAIWFRKNGVDMVESNTEMQVPKQGSTGKLVAAWNIVEPLDAYDYLEIVWASADTTYELLYQPAQVTPYTKPSTPSIIVTVTQV